VRRAEFINARISQNQQQQNHFEATGRGNPFVENGFAARDFVKLSISDS
jgi:hypothetical protein